MKAPDWMRTWRDELLATRPELAIDVNAFRVCRKARSLPDVDAAVMKMVRAPLAPLTLRVGEEMRGHGLDTAFRLDFVRGDKPIRSYGIAWRKEKGTFMALQCPADADELRDDQQWTIEVQLSKGQTEGKEPVIYRAMYSHLLDGGRALTAEQLERVRAVNRALAALGLELTTIKDDDPLCRPVLRLPGQAATAILRQVAATVVARQVLAGLMGSGRWAPNAAALLGLRPASALDAYSRAYRWDDERERDVKPLESELVRRFQGWIARIDPTTDPELAFTDVAADFDGQIPDLAIGPRQRVAIIEAKLGHTRDSVRTGLSQAREYAFHARTSPAAPPVCLLIGEPPQFHGRAFAEFVVDAARRLEVPVVVEQINGSFARWAGAEPAWSNLAARQPVLAGALAGK